VPEQFDSEVAPAVTELQTVRSGRGTCNAWHAYIRQTIPSSDCTLKFPFALRMAAQQVQLPHIQGLHLNTDMHMLIYPITHQCTSRKGKMYTLPSPPMRTQEVRTFPQRTVYPVGRTRWRLARSSTCLPSAPPCRQPHVATSTQEWRIRGTLSHAIPHTRTSSSLREQGSGRIHLEESYPRLPLSSIGPTPYWFVNRRKTVLQESKIPFITQRDSKIYNKKQRGLLR
jgi:hypothetical protein